jgi:hypothetical protein
MVSNFLFLKLEWNLVVGRNDVKGACFAKFYETV